MTLAPIAKAVVAFVTGLQAWGATALADGHVTGDEWFGLLGVLVIVVGVWGVPNTPTTRGGRS